MLIDYLPILVYMLIAVGLVGVIVLLSELVGRKTHSVQKDMPYECGMDPIGDARSRYTVRFYIIAMFFIVFDIEAIFLYPWARGLQTPGLVRPGGDGRLHRHPGGGAGLRLG